RSVPVGAQRDDAGRVAPGRDVPDVLVHDRVGPGLVEVDLVSRLLQEKKNDPGRAAPDLGELQPLRREEPLHVGRGGADAERLVNPPAEVAQLLVVRLPVDPVRRDELRRDPPGAHRLQHVREVVADEVQPRLAVHRQRVIEALVALDELLDRDRVGVAERAQRGAELVPGVDLGGVQRAGTGTRLEDQRVADRVGERVDLVHVRGGRGGRGRHAHLPQRLLHRRLVPAQPGRPDAGAGDRAGLPYLRHRQRVRLDRCLQPVHPHPGLHPADEVGQVADVGHVVDLVILGQASAQLVVQPLTRPLADADDVRAGPGQRAGEVPLGGRERRLHEHHVHARTLLGPAVRWEAQDGGVSDHPDQPEGADRSELAGAPVGRRVLLGVLALGGLTLAFGRTLSDAEQAALAVVGPRDPTGLTQLIPAGAGFRFYSVTASIPRRAPADVRIAVAGLVRRPRTWSMAELAALPQARLVRDFQCVTGWRVPAVTWSGVALPDL